MAKQFNGRQLALSHKCLPSVSSLVGRLEIFVPVVSGDGKYKSMNAGASLIHARHH